MIVADTSAIMAVVMDEAESRSFELMMYQDGEVLVSAATAVELAVVCLRRSDDLHRDDTASLARGYIQLVPFDEVQMRSAANAFRRYGRGRAPAALNFGDTFSYAFASSRGLPLWFKGEDFLQTDIVPAALPGPQARGESKLLG